MEISKQTKLQFLGVEIVNVQLDIRNRSAETAPLNISIEPKLFFPEDDQNRFSIFMPIDLKSEDFFSLSIVGIGNFIVDAEDEKMRKSFIHSNAPAIMFPYLRSFISTLSGNLGGIINTIVLPPHFFKGEMQELLAGSVDEENKVINDYANTPTEPI